MLLVVMMPIDGISRKHFRMVEACVQRIPEGMAKRPEISLVPSR